MPSVRKKPQVKLTDVASDAEVSVATASLALRNDPSISEATRRRVLEAQKRLGYRPIRNRTYSAKTGSGSRAGVCRHILYCVARFPIRKIQYADFLEGVMGACEEKKITLSVKSLESPDVLAESKADGIILTGELTQRDLDALTRIHPKLLVLGSYPFFDVNRVEFDVFGIGEQMAERLVARGHRHVVHLTRNSKNYFERQLLMGIRDGLEAQGIPLPADRVLHVENLTSSITQLAARIPALSPKITAVTCAASNVAEGFLVEMRLLQARGSNRPPEIYTTAIMHHEQPPPGLHLLDLGLERCGWLAVERLCQMRENPRRFPFSCVVQSAGWMVPEAS